MKRVLLLLALAFLVQSCYSYRIETKPNEMVVGKRYKIKSNHGSTKGLIKSISDNSVVLKKRNFEEVEIPLSEITQAKRRKFSVLKTIGYPIAAIVVTAGIFALSYDGPDIKFGNINPPKH